MPSSTMRRLNAGPPSCFFGFSGVLEWNQEHQHPPHTTLCFSISAASASHVSGESGLMKCSSIEVVFH